MPITPDINSIATRVRLGWGAAVISSIFLLTACPMQDQPAKVTLPRFTQLDAFDPHRKNFECKNEADVNPPFTAEAEALFQQGMTATAYPVWPADRDYKKAAEVWDHAAKLGHWKAKFNLAGMYLKGDGVPQNIEKALQLTEELMRQGVPAAWDNMGTYYMGGVGDIKQDASVAYAFWQKAADMGSRASQAYLGEKLNAGHDDPPSFWGNYEIGRKMLECALAQGSGKAAYELGLTFDGDSAKGGDYARALKTLHEGVKLGSEQSANRLSVAFDSGAPLIENRLDPARAERYTVLKDALWHNPDLRFPNLDKVLPLPPAQLPKWDGNKDTLIDAAKALVPAPVVKPTPGAKLTGRANIPEGWRLPANPVPPQMEAVGIPHPHSHTVMAQYETTPARFSGYWLPQLANAGADHHEDWNRAQVPLRYAPREAFEPHREGLSQRDGRVMWHYKGVPVQQATIGDHPKVAQGLARYTRIPEPRQRCQGDAACTHTGIWYAHVSDHRLASTYSTWDRQAYVEKGASFPKPADIHLAIEASEVTWLWLGQANVQTSPHYETVSLDEAGRGEDGNA